MKAMPLGTCTHSCRKRDLLRTKSHRWRLWVIGRAARSCDRGVGIRPGRSRGWESSPKETDLWHYTHSAFISGGTPCVCVFVCWCVCFCVFVCVFFCILLTFNSKRSIDYANSILYVFIYLVITIYDSYDVIWNSFKMQKIKFKIS